MRLHHLRMRAFGPFAGTEQVDFDELCEAGLFLLTGPTGAGKTTILDAVCFALYGSVPGVRGVKALKSQHAAPQDRPEVVLDFSVRERRFVIRRSPEWSRPKRRGTGFTTENASATLVETTSGSDHLLSSRAQEVGHLIGELIGMQSTQFVQVAMLPQGDFQKFLRASSQDRHDVLQHLFRSDRYARIEDWVNDHSRELRQRSDALRQEVVRTLDAVADRVDIAVPDELEADALLAPEGPEHALAWVDVLLERAAADQEAARRNHTTAVEAASAARVRTADALHQVGLQRRRAEALEALDRLAAGAGSAEEARSLLDADVRASRCHGLEAMLAESRTAADRSARDLAAAMQELAEAESSAPDGPAPRTPPAAVSADVLSRREQSTRTALARVEALLPREQELVDARHRATLTRDQLASTRAEAARLDERARDLPAALAAARSEASVLDAAAARRAALSLELEQAVRRHEAAGAAQVCAAELERLEDAERSARDRALDARGRVQDLTARRLAGIAAELAGQLTPGGACQVCGGTEHPAPAEPLGELVTEPEQSAADTEHDAATAALSAAAGDVVRTRERLAGFRAAAGGVDVSVAAGLVEDLEERLRLATAASEALAPAQAAVERLDSEERKLTSSRHDLALRVAGLEQTLATEEQQIEQLTAELDAAVEGVVEPGGDNSGLAELSVRLGGLAEALGRAREVRCDHDDADARARDLAARTDEAAREQGFADAGALAEARLPGPERDRLQGELAERAQAETRARAVLDEAEVRALEGRPAVDPVPLQAALELGEDEAADAARARHQCEETHTALRRQQERLSAALAAWAPVRADFLRAEGMSRLVRGMGHDNQLQMRLSAYVLATRLDQVVDAANERLGHMRDQRYLLQRTGRVARKGAQAGLGLEVVDQWTGDVRDPGTLSGGETFVVSLSLALGLADVVTQEAGGTEIETLFVDEGFGTLDAETLDDVMDRLDELRAGGRAVGVVSHVSELRNRIPTQLHVEKLRTGSTVAVRTAVG